MSQILGNPWSIPFSWSRNSQWGLLVATTGKSRPNFSSPVLARPSFPSLWCFRASEFLLSNRCFHTPDFPLFPFVLPGAQVFFPLGVLAPESLLSNCCSRVLDFRLSPSSCSRAPCLPLFHVKFLSDRLSSFSLGVFCASDFPLLLCVHAFPYFSPLQLVFPRAWVSLARGVPVWPNLSFTVSIPARRIYPFSLRVRACVNFSFPLGVLAGLIFPFLLLFSCACYFLSFFSRFSSSRFPMPDFSSFLDACHAYFAVYKC